MPLATARQHMLSWTACPADLAGVWKADWPQAFPGNGNILQLGRHLQVTNDVGITCPLEKTSSYNGS